MTRLAAFGLLAALSSSGASAVCLLSDYSVQSEFHRSDYVARVQVQRETWLDMKWRPTRLKQPLQFGSLPSGLDPYAGANYRVRPTSQFKGRLPPQFDIFSENTTGRFPFQVGKDYLVFLDRAPSGDAYIRAGSLTADNCGNSGLWSESRRAATQVRGLAREPR